MVTATDPAGVPNALPQEVTITVNDVNEAPMISEGFTRKSQLEYNSGDTTGDEQARIDTAKVVDTYMATDPEISAGTCAMASCTWSVSGTDAGDFDISNETATFGALTFKEAPNFEMPADSNGDNVYMVTVVVTDQDTKQKLSARRGVTITVTNVDEDGTVTLSSDHPKVGIALTATLDDPDGVVADSVKWTWHAFVENAVTDDNAIAMATSATYTPEETDPLSVRARYTDGHGASKLVVKETANTVVPNLANVAPKFLDTETGMRVVAEGTEAGLPIDDAAGDPDPVVADDPTDTLLTYTLSGTDAASFDIVRSSGLLQTKAKLDYEVKSSYMVTVTATDSEGLSASIEVTIMVTNVDEEPEIAGEDFAEDFRENGSNLQIERFRATDPEGRKVYWSLLPVADVNGIVDVDAADAADVDTFHDQQRRGAELQVLPKL